MNDIRISRQYTLFFDYAIIFFAFFYAIRMSQLNNSVFVFLKYPALVLSLTFSLISVIRNYRWNKVNTTVFVLFSIIPLYLRLKYDSNVLSAIWLMFAAYNIPFSHLTRKCIQAIVIVFVVVLTALMIGLVDDRLYDRDTDLTNRAFAHDLGFIYYSFYAYPLMGLIVCFLYLWQFKLKLSKLIFVVFIGYCCFVVSTTRLQLYACFLLIILVYIIRILPICIMNAKIWLLIGITSFPLLCYLICFISMNDALVYALDNFSEINTLTSGRLTLNLEAFRRYDVNLWGNKIETITDVNSSNYFFIDSGYISTLLENGLVWCCILLLIQSVICFKLYKAKSFFLYYCMILFAFLNLINGFMEHILFNPILLLAFSSIQSIRDDLDSLRRVKLKKS